MATHPYPEFIYLKMLIIIVELGCVDKEKEVGRKNEPDVLGGVPPFRGKLPALRVVNRRVQDGDAHISILKRSTKFLLLVEPSQRDRQLESAGSLFCVSIRTLICEGVLLVSPSPVGLQT